MKRMDRLTRTAGIGLLVALGVVPVPAGAESTVKATVAGADGSRLLKAGPGEPYVVRSDLARRSTNAPRGRPLLTFAQFTDTHVIDEESPLRLEFLDQLGAPLTSAYRPQEGLAPHVMAEMARQVRETPSPATGRRAQLVMTTGDNSDNAQLNEVRTFIDLMDGGSAINPDSGVARTCGLAGAAGPRYDGVRGSRLYYEPDSSGRSEGAGYAPNRAANQAAIGRPNRMRDFPGLFEIMNAPFPAPGVGVPWYSVFGNHDALIQGNAPRNPALAALATGCVKPIGLSLPAQQALSPLVAGGLTPDRLAQAYAIITTDLLATAANPALIGTLAKIVPSDPARRPLKKSEYIREHFTTRGRPVGHGFKAANVASGMGNFAFAPQPGLRFIALDTLNEAGYADGNIDETQFRWLHDQLAGAEGRREMVLVFAHHSLRTMNWPGGVPFPVGDGGGDPTPRVHFGLGPNGQTARCPTTDPSVQPPRGETLRCLFLRHRSVIAFVSGHEHINRVTPFARPNPRDGGFWEITTASHIDWPQQSRLIDILNNGDGTVSLIGTILDHAAPARAEIPPTAPVTADGVRQLAAIARELSFNDPQADNGLDERADARGTPLDRNVELLVRDPYRRR